MFAGKHRKAIERNGYQPTRCFAVKFSRRNAAPTVSVVEQRSCADFGLDLSTWTIMWFLFRVCTSQVIYMKPKSRLSVWEPGRGMLRCSQNLAMKCLKVLSENAGFFRYIFSPFRQKVFSQQHTCCVGVTQIEGFKLGVEIKTHLNLNFSSFNSCKTAKPAASIFTAVTQLWNLWRFPKLFDRR